MNPAVTRLLLGMVAAAGTAYFMDPTSGRRRRTVVREQVAGAASRLSEGTREARRGLSDRASRFADEAKSRWRGEKSVDEAMARRVRSAIRQAIARRGIGVWTSEGRVLLHGDVLPHEHETLLRAVRSMPGVSDVVDHLIERESLDGGGASSQQAVRVSAWKRHMDLTQENWPPTARLVTGLVGAALVANAARHRSVIGVISGVVGSSLLLRSATNRPLTRLGRGQGVIDVHKSIVVHAPLERVFGLLEAYENFPSFMRNVREVRRHEDGRSHWVVAGPAGSTVEWDAVTTVHRPNEMLAWHSAPSAEVEHSGVIRLERLDDDQTRIDVRMSYSPPAGAFGHVVAKLFGSDAHTELEADLARLRKVAESWDTWRSVVETGKAAREGRRMRTVANGAEGSESHVA